MEAVPPYRADVAIRGDSIVAIVKDLSNSQCRERLDVRGKCLVPGFIDLHSHADGPDINTGLRSYNPIRRAALNLVTQGITTVVVNQDGRCPIDIARQFSLNSPLLSIEKTIYSMSELPATILNLPDRGFIREFYKADIVVIEPKTIRDRATYLQPHQYASGVDFVWVNAEK